MLGFASSPQPTALNHLAQGVMDDAVAKRRGTDLAPLRLMNEEVAIGAGAIGLAAQVLLQGDQPVGHLLLERRRAALAAFAARCDGKGLPGDGTG